MTTEPLFIDHADHYIGGRYIVSTGAKRIAVFEAATGRRLGVAPDGTAADVDMAVGAARSAMEGPWGTLTATERADYLRAFAHELTVRADSTAELVTRENGMPISLSGPVNGVTPAALLGYYARLGAESETEELRVSRRSRTIVRKEPVGVVAAIAPWNYPQALAMMKIAPALAAGCTVVVKPAPETALDAYALADAASGAGLPDGVFNLVTGGRETGQALIEHPGVDKVAFTGSTSSGRAIGQACGQHLKPVSLELGGKSAAILLEDVDLDVLATKLFDATLVNNGQTCFSNSRILIPASRYEPIVELISSLVTALRVGDPLDPATQIGPVVSATQREKVLRYIGLGRSSSARLTAGGDIPHNQPNGWFVEPTVFADVNNDDVLAREEIFGPVLALIKYRDVDDAVRVANDSEFGLAGSVWSVDAEAAVGIARRIRTGTVGINGYRMDFKAPFGGIKASGFGREMGPEGLLPYSATKSIYL